MRIVVAPHRRPCVADYDRRDTLRGNPTVGDAARATDSDMSSTANYWRRRQDGSPPFLEDKGSDETVQHRSYSEAAP